MRFEGIWSVAILVVSINTGAYMAETVRGGILSVDPGQTEGAKAIGMTHFQTMTYVILPQALRNIMPQIGNNLIINIKDTSVMFIIGFAEFLRAQVRRRVLLERLFPIRHDRDISSHHDLLVVPAALVGKEDGRLRQLRARARPTRLAHTSGTYNRPQWQPGRRAQQGAQPRWNRNRTGEIAEWMR
jgi:hypothetical protein